MAIVRRRLLGALGLSVLGATPAAALARSEQTAAALDTALAESPLLYPSPLRSNGALSRCQAEVWFQALPGAAVVVTRSDAWRARARLNRRAACYRKPFAIGQHSLTLLNRLVGLLRQTQDGICFQALNGDFQMIHRFTHPNWVETIV